MHAGVEGESDTPVAAHHLTILFSLGGVAC